MIYDVQLQKTNHYACNRGTKQPWRSHYNATPRYPIARHNLRNDMTRNCSSKTGSRRQRKKKTTISKHFLQGIQENHQRQNWENLLTNHYIAALPWCSHSNTIHEPQLQKDISITPQRRATLTQPLQCDIELQNTIELRATAWEIAAPEPDLMPKQKKHDFEALFQRNFNRKITYAKIEKI